MADRLIAREAFYRGRVQGVGFRYTARGIAQRFAVKGFVRNLEDGSVHLLAIGLSSEVDRFLAAIREALDENIADVTCVEVPVPDGHGSFEIRT